MTLGYTKAWEGRKFNFSHTSVMDSFSKPFAHVCHQLLIVPAGMTTHFYWAIVCINNRSFAYKTPILCSSYEHFGKYQHFYFTSHMVAHASIFKDFLRMSKNGKQNQVGSVTSRVSV